MAFFEILTTAFSFFRNHIIHIVLNIMCVHDLSTQNLQPSSAEENDQTKSASSSSEMYFGASLNSQPCMGASPNIASYGNAQSPTDSRLQNAEGSSPQLSYYGGSQHYGYQPNQQNTSTASKSTYELYKEWCNAWGNNPQDTAVSSNCVNQQPTLISI